MKPVAIGALSVLIIGASGWLMLNREPASSADATSFKPAASSTTANLGGQDSTPDFEASQVIKLRQRIDDLTVELEAVVDKRSSAEAMLQRAERDVAALERFIEEIEERGDDPVDYADEGLAMYRPAFDAYQEAADKLELAENKEQSTTKALAAAERELATMLFDQGIY